MMMMMMMQLSLLEISIRIGLGYSTVPDNGRRTPCTPTPMTGVDASKMYVYPRMYNYNVD